jgi:hypothetical protein
VSQGKERSHQQTVDTTVFSQDLFNLRDSWRLRFQLHTFGT